MIVRVRALLYPPQFVIDKREKGNRPLPYLFSFSGEHEIDFSCSRETLKRTYEGKILLAGFPNPFRITRCSRWSLCVRGTMASVSNDTLCYLLRKQWVIHKRAIVFYGLIDPTKQLELALDPKPLQV